MAYYFVENTHQNMEYEAVTAQYGSGNIFYGIDIVERYCYAAARAERNEALVVCWTKFNFHQKERSDALVV